MKPICIAIIGAGFGGIYAFRRLRALFHNARHIHLTLVSEKNYFLFTPLLHEVATGGVHPHNIVEPIRKVLGCRLDSFYMAKVERISFTDCRIDTPIGTFQYDYCVLATGSETDFYDVRGAASHTFTLKSLQDAVRLKNHCIASFERASHAADNESRQRMLHFIVVDGGPTGVELATELEEFLRETFGRYYSRELMAQVRISLIQKTGELLPHFSKSLQEKSLEVVMRKSIRVFLDSSVIEVEAGHVVLNDGTRLLSDTVVWTAGVKPALPALVGDVRRERDGRLIVRDTLQLEGYPQVFAIGDIAALRSKEGRFLPAQAQVATREAAHAAENIARLIRGETPMPFAYRHAGSLVSLGQWMAVGEVSRFVFWGRFTWWLWRTVYLSKLISWRKKIRVAVDWTMNLFSPRDISEL